MCIVKMQMDVCISDAAIGYFDEGKEGNDSLANTYIDTHKIHK